MGIGNITLEREVEKGSLAGKGASVAPSSGPAASPFAAMRGVDMDPLNARRIALENLKPVAEAWRRSQHAIEGNEMVAKGMLDLDEMSNGMPDGENKGMWKDGRGVWRQALNTPGLDVKTREELTEACEKELERRQAERLKGWTPDMITTVRTRMKPAREEWRARQMEQSMTLQLREGMDKTVSSHTMIGASINAQATEEFKNVDRCGQNLSSVCDIGTVTVNATQVRDREIVRSYVRKMIEAKGEAMRDIMLAGGGLVSEAEAEKQVNRIYGSSVVDFVRRLAESGEYGRAMSLVEDGESLGFSPEDVEKGKGLVDGISGRQAQVIANSGLVAAAERRLEDKVNADGSVSPGLESTIAGLRKLYGTIPDGFKSKAAAAETVARMDAAADAVAQQEVLDEYLAALGNDPKARIYVAETRDEKGNVKEAAKNAFTGMGRKERLAPLVQQMVDEQRVGTSSQMRRNRVAELKMRMLSGAKNPGEYHDEVFRAAKDGEIELSDYYSLTKEFDKSWANGFEAGMKSPKQQLAERMLRIIQEYFPSTALGTSYEWDDKTATVKLKKDATYDGLEYEEKVGRGSQWRSLGIATGLILPSTSRTHKIDPAGVEKIINVATELSYYNGMRIDYDPMTGERKDFFTGEEIRTGKDSPGFNAENYFRNYMKRLADVEQATQAAEEIMKLDEAEKKARVWYLNAQDQNKSEIVGSEKKRQSSVVTIKNRKLGAGTAQKR